MAYPLAGGVRNIGTDTMRYIPIIYAAKVMKEYRARTVLTKISNTDYEGEIKQYGDTVWIRVNPIITVRDYRKGQNLVNEQPESAAIQLLIDKGKYWSFVTYDLDKVQTDIKGYTDSWAESGSFEISKAIDTQVLAALPAACDASNIGSTAGAVSSAYDMGTDGTPRVVTKADILDAFVDAGSVLDEQNVPGEGRWMLIPPRVAGLLSKSDLKNAALMGEKTSVIRTGFLGEIARFDLYQSNLLSYGQSSTTSAYCTFGVKEALTFATQMVESKIQDDPFGFGKLHRGLNVYGFKVVKSKGLGSALLSVT